MLDIVDHAILRLLHEGMIDIVHNADDTSKIVLTKLGRQYGRRNSHNGHDLKLDDNLQRSKR